jgi:hypothetical protein
VGEKISEQDISFVQALNTKVVHYNSGNRHFKKIAPFTDVSDATARIERIKSHKKASDHAIPPAHELFISNCIFEHFKPYLEGKITIENEDKNRRPLTQILLDRLHKQYPGKPFSEEEVRNFALETYVATAVRQFYAAFRQEQIRQTGDYHGARITNEGQIEPLIKALEHAMAIDFKELKLTPDKILELVKRRVRVEYEQWQDSEPSDVDKSNAERTRRAKFEKLQKNPKDLFLQ